MNAANEGIGYPFDPAAARCACRWRSPAGRDRGTGDAMYELFAWSDAHATAGRTAPATS
jgi:hypothetical protein